MAPLGVQKMLDIRQPGFGQVEGDFNFQQNMLKIDKIDALVEAMLTKLIILTLLSLLTMLTMLNVDNVDNVIRHCRDQLKQR